MCIKTNLRRPQQVLDLTIAANPFLYFLLKNAYKIGFMQEFDDPSHWAKGVTVFIISSSSALLAPPFLFVSKVYERKKNFISIFSIEIIT